MTEQPADDTVEEPTTCDWAQPEDLKNQSVIDQITKVVGNGIKPSTVAAVLSAWHLVHTGDPVGMVRKDPDTGAVAIRVQSDGMPMWRVATPAGEQYNDLQPTLPWPTLG